MTRYHRTERLRMAFFCCWYALLAVVGWTWQPASPQVSKFQSRSRGSVEVVVSRDWRQQALQDLEEASPFAALAARDLAEISDPEAFALMVAYATGTRTCSANSLLPTAAIEALVHYQDQGREVLQQIASSPDAGKRRLHAVRSLEKNNSSESVGALRGAFEIALRQDDWATVRLSQALLKDLTGEEASLDLGPSPPLS